VIKKPYLASSHQPQAPTINDQTTTLIASEEVRDVASHAADQAHNAINANESNNHNALATAIAALREAESKVSVSEEAIKEAKVALERARVEIIRVSEGKGFADRR